MTDDSATSSPVSPQPRSLIWSKGEVVLPLNISKGVFLAASTTWPMRSVSELESSSFLYEKL